MITSTKKTSPKLVFLVGNTMQLLDIMVTINIPTYCGFSTLLQSYLYFSLLAFKTFSECFSLSSSSSVSFSSIAFSMPFLPRTQGVDR